MKYALITGASRGIGKAIALHLAAKGTPVIINYLKNAEAAQAVADEITAQGGTAELLPFDTSKPQETEAALDRWEDAHPDDYIGVLVNNAGIRRDNVMFMMSDEEWHSVMDTTMNGFFYITRRLLKHMMPRKRTGRIVNVASLSGVKGLPGQANYSAAKAALIGATKALAQEVAPRDVTVNATFAQEVITSIDQIDADRDSNSVRYNINGQRVSGDYRGIIIENGKMRVVR